MTSKFMSAVHQKASCTTNGNPSWGKAEKLKVKTIVRRPGMVSKATGSLNH
jgi:hypothetical protein